MVDWMGGAGGCTRSGGVRGGGFDDPHPNIGYLC